MHTIRSHLHPHFEIAPVRHQPLRFGGLFSLPPTFQGLRGSGDLGPGQGVVHKEMGSWRDHGRGSKHQALANSGQSCLIHRGSPNLPWALPGQGIYTLFKRKSLFKAKSENHDMTKVRVQASFTPSGAICTHISKSHRFITNRCDLVAFSTNRFKMARAQQVWKSRARPRSSP